MRRKKRNRGWFRRGFDARRHLLTSEERSRGGVTRWRQTMAEVRWELNLDPGSLEVMAEAKKHFREKMATEPANWREIPW
jgi:hypothetical protein